MGVEKVLLAHGWEVILVPYYGGYIWRLYAPDFALPRQEGTATKRDAAEEEARQALRGYFR